MIKKLKQIAGKLAGKQDEQKSIYESMTPYELDVVRSSIVQDIVYFSSNGYDVSSLNNELISLSKYSNINPESLMLMSQIQDLSHRLNIFRVANEKRGDGVLTIEFEPKNS